MKVDADRAMLCGLFSVTALLAGLGALEIQAQNHQRALDLHERQRALSATAAVNERLSIRLAAHMPVPSAPQNKEQSRP